jgi:hypothetical protein
VKGKRYKFTFSFQPICTGNDQNNKVYYHQSITFFGFVGFILVFIIVGAFFFTFGLAIAVFIGKKKMMTNNHLIKPPKSLESQVINITLIGLLIFSILCNVLYWGR